MRRLHYDGRDYFDWQGEMARKTLPGWIGEAEARIPGRSAAERANALQWIVE